MLECVLHSAKGVLELGGHLLHFMEGGTWQESGLKTNKVRGHSAVNQCCMGGQGEEARVHHQWIWSCVEKKSILSINGPVRPALLGWHSHPRCVPCADAQRWDAHPRHPCLERDRRGLPGIQAWPGILGTCVGTTGELVASVDNGRCKRSSIHPGAGP